VTSFEDLPIRDDLRGLSPYGAPQIDVPYPLNTNENPYGPPPELVADLRDAVTSAATTLNRYPDRDAVELRKDLADYLGHSLTAENLWAANGSNEVIQQILQCFGGPDRTAIGFEPSYTMHRLISLGTATGWISGLREGDYTLDAGKAIAAIEEHRPDIVFLTSPNNPTGTALPMATIEAVVKAAPGMVVVDEAYFEFARPGTPSALTLLPGAASHQKPGRLIVTRTMSKAFAMAGARVGYLAADPAVIDALMLVRLPYHLSALTQAAARTALKHVAALLGTVDAVKEQRDRIVSELTARGLHVVPSDANFVLFGVGGDGDQKAVWQKLLDQGVLVRDIGLPGMLRVTAGTPEETSAFLEALKEAL
jgi:histidinol-phosphate aminotransferase